MTRIGDELRKAADRAGASTISGKKVESFPPGTVGVMRGEKLPATGAQPEPERLVGTLESAVIRPAAEPEPVALADLSSGAVEAISQALCPRPHAKDRT